MFRKLKPLPSSGVREETDAIQFSRWNGQVKILVAINADIVKDPSRSGPSLNFLHMVLERGSFSGILWPRI
jgi:hypothetical protein